MLGSVTAASEVGKTQIVKTRMFHNLPSRTQTGTVPSASSFQDPDSSVPTERLALSEREEKPFDLDFCHGHKRQGLLTAGSCRPRC